MWDILQNLKFALTSVRLDLETAHQAITKSINCQMFAINYSVCNEDFFQLEFTYKSDVEISMCISGDSVIADRTCSDWVRLVEEEDFCLEFGDEYGSHVDNGIVSIKHKNSKLEFLVDGAKGGELSVKLPISVCKSEFYALSKLMEIELPKALEIIDQRE